MNTAMVKARKATALARLIIGLLRMPAKETRAVAKSKTEHKAMTPK